MAEVVVLSGGVGGARFVRGLVDLVGPREVTVIGNVGDDDEFFGLHVSPDLDSIVYALADLHDEQRGWGRRRETWNALDTARALGDPETWFQLGDRDLGLHLVRTKALKAGEPLSAVTARIAAAFDVEVPVLPATDDRLRTIVETPAGAFSLQEWFVGRQHKDKVDGLRFEGAAFAKPAPGVLDAIEQASLVVIAPSNPYISVWPILAVRRDPRHGPAEAHPRGRRQPARRRQGGQGPGRRDDEAARRRDEPGPRRALLPGAARRARDRPGGCRRRGRRWRRSGCAHT